MDASTVTLALAGIAVIVGLVVAFELVRARPRADARARHPSTGPPLTITLARSGDEARWRFDLPAGRPTTAIDIVTYRPVGSSADWKSEPIVDPIEIAPGGSAFLPSVVGDPSTPYELVVAWTIRSAEGDVTGSGTFVVDAARSVVAGAERSTGRAWLAAGSAIVAMLVIAGGVVVWRLADGPHDGTVAARPARPTTVVPAPTASSATTIAAATTVEIGSSTEPAGSTTATTSPATTSAPAAATATSAPTTAAAAAAPATTSVPNTSTPGTSAPTSSSSAANSTSTPSNPPDGPAVMITGRVEDCRFGAQCLIAGFTIARFDTQPQEYVCEFSDGSRTTFRFGGTGVETACSQAGTSPSITVEVDNIRSETITRESVADT